jgi:ABC-type transport system involved in multi-copper enzyme maturation permease subunit
MLSIFNIWSVARYEAKTLLRSWFFRIFAGLALFFIGAFDVIFFSGAVKDAPWFFRAIPSFIPLMNVSWLNLIQAVLAVFLSTEFLKRDKKMDTTEVIYMRNMSNGDYIFGKLLGNLMVFIGFNLVLLLFAGVINGVFSDRPVSWVAFALYPIMISLPTLVFTFGLAFVMMLLIRNQAVTFVLLLGYAACSLFFIRDRVYGLFDYLAFYQPLIISDFVGLSSATLLWMQRGSYLLLGFIFIFAAMLLLPRLPQSPGLRKMAGAIIIVFSAACVVMVALYLDHFQSGLALRSEMNRLNQTAMQQPPITILTLHLDVVHQGASLQIDNHLVFINDSPGPVSQAVFSLNPGWKVDEIACRGQSCAYVRNAHLLTISFQQPLAPSQVDSLLIRYHGAPNEQACYSWLDEETRARRQQQWTFTADKKYCFVENDYVLLTPECLWYPKSGVPAGAAFPSGEKRDFVRYTLQVKTRPGLQVISQGDVEEQQNGRFLFKCETPLSQLSLIIGRYVKQSLQVDQVSYNLYHRRGHDYFTPYFKNIQDTLAVVLRELKQDYERQLGLSYPYRRLNLVETPVQFTTYERMWTIQQENSLPEMILLPEYGLGVTGAEFPERIRRLERNARQMNQVYTPEEMQARLFRTFVESALLGNRMERSFRENWTSFPGHYSIFPLYYTAGNYFYSEKYPLFNTACESYLYNRSIDQDARQTPSRPMMFGNSDEELANEQLKKSSLLEILQDKQKRALAGDVLRIKGAYLFKNIESHLGAERFPKFINQYLLEHRFRQMPVDALIGTLRERFGYDLQSDYVYWQESNKLPAFLVGDVQAYKVLDQDRSRYQVRFKIANPEPVSGLVAVNFRRGGPPGMGGGPGMGGPRGMEGGRGGFNTNRGASEPDRLYRLAAGEVKEIGVVLDDAPQVLAINTLISQNLPLQITQPLGEIKERPNAAPFSGEQPTVMPPPSNDVIVDNEEPGFRFNSQVSISLLKRWMPDKSDEQEMKYKAISWWNPAQNWTFTTGNDFYGHYIHSAVYVKSGKGDKTAQWTAQIPANGQYDVFFHIGRIPGSFRERGGGSRGRQNTGDFHLKVHHDDGIEEVTIDVTKAEPGWLLLCSHYFSAGEAQVEISNESNGRIVYADAVKWVKR